MSDRLLLDRLGADAWPPLERVDVDGWRLRAARTGAGAPVTKRANSALPLVPTTPTPLTQALVDAVVAVALRCLSQVAAPAGYIALQRGGQVVATGRGVVQEGWLGVFAMAVRPEHRRAGLARRVLGALGAWGSAHGATGSYLQVEVGSTAARRLYESSGMIQAYDDEYRRLPC